MISNDELAVVEHDCCQALNLALAATQAPWLLANGRHLVTPDGLELASFPNDDDWEDEHRANLELIRGSRTFSRSAAVALLAAVQTLTKIANSGGAHSKRATTTLEWIAANWNPTFEHDGK